jgi:hypothetical protein
MKSSQVILSAVVIAATTTLASEYLRHQPVRYGRTITGALATGLGLSLIDTGSPEVAQGLATLIIITSILVNGEPIFTALNKGVK